jgi:hypothetical protein
MVMSGDRNAGRVHSVKIDNSSIERVEEFKYLGTTLTDQNWSRLICPDFMTSRGTSGSYVFGGFLLCRRSWIEGLVESRSPHSHLTPVIDQKPLCTVALWGLHCGFCPTLSYRFLLPAVTILTVVLSPATMLYCSQADKRPEWSKAYPEAAVTIKTHLRESACVVEYHLVGCFVNCRCWGREGT